MMHGESRHTNDLITYNVNKASTDTQLLSVTYLCANESLFAAVHVERQTGEFLACGLAAD